MNLTPAQRAAAIRVAESLAVSALLTALTAITPYLEGFDTIRWQSVGFVFLVTFFFSVIHGVLAFFESRNQTKPDAQTSALLVIAESIADAFEARIQKLIPPIRSTLAPANASPLVTIHTSSAPTITTTTTSATDVATTTSTETTEPPAIGSTISDAKTQKIEKSALPNATIPLENNGSEDTQSSIAVVKKAL